MDEGNNANPARVWGTNGSDSYLRTYLTSALSVNYANSAGNADKLLGMSWVWSGRGGQPTWLWGSSDGQNVNVYNPSNFSVSYAATAGSATNADSLNGYTAAQIFAKSGGIESQLLGPAGYVKFSSGIVMQWGVNVVPANGTTQVALPIAFPNACLWAAGNAKGFNPGAIDGNDCGVLNWTATTLTLYSDDNVFETAWFAIGH